ncbi:hypothetical protein KBD59_03620 [Candidatus Gracilibacteria bacterium]|nr:hypothetical protein [Candidatus Gracilibacteria bacterium]
MNFLQQLEELRRKTPRLFNINIGSENSDYCTHSDKNKNSYLLFAANYCEDSMYSGLLVECTDCVDCTYAEKCELCFECTDAYSCYNCTYSQLVKNCSDSSFCYDCVGCRNCFGCVGLTQKEYCYFNQQLTKEAYLEAIKQYDVKNPEHVQFAFDERRKLELTIPRRAVRMINSEQCTGDNIYNSKNCDQCFDLHDSQDSIHLNDCWRTNDSVDLSFSDGSELCYECFSIGLGCYNDNFCNYIRGSSDCEYSELLFSCKNCFGCVSLQSKEYYILNEPYSKDDYFKKVAEIKAQMNADGTYGKHIISSYKFEDTAAAEV